MTMNTLRRFLANSLSILTPPSLERGLGWAATLCLGMGLTSCTDHYDLGKLQNPSKLVVYCFPATDDTTYINVTASVGVKKFTDTRGIRTLDDAQVTYRVNGQKRPVHQLSALLPGVDDAKGVFYVLGGHQPGDRVEIVVSHPDYSEATAEATMPEAVPVSLDRVVSTTEFDPDWYDSRTFHKLLATFTDPAATEDYYAVRVCKKQYSGSATGHLYEGGQEISTWYISNIDDYRRLCEQYPAIEWEVEVSDSTISWPEIVINDEPLLNPLSEIDSDFGFSSDFYGGFCIFSDEQISGQTYTLHLNIPTYNHRGEENSWGEAYSVLLYRISPEFYRFLKSYNDMANNELAQGGFAPVSPTLSNVSGGFGLLGTYATGWSNWKRTE